MSWSYLSSDPGSSGKSWVRLRIGDTSSGDQLLSDEEINVFLDGEGNKYLAAAVAAETVGAQFARKVDKTVGRLRIAHGKAADAYFRTADRLRREMATRVAPYAGGISEADKDDAEDREDRVQPAFSRGMHDFAEPSTTDP